MLVMLRMLVALLSGLVVAAVAAHFFPFSSCLLHLTSSPSPFFSLSLPCPSPHHPLQKQLSAKKASGSTAGGAGSAAEGGAGAMPAEGEGEGAEEWDGN